VTVWRGISVIGVVTLWLAVAPAARAAEPEVIVLAGFEETRAWLSEEGWWGEVNREEQLSAPNVLITGISLRWRERSAALPVSEKKEVFYRFLLPLILHANDMVRRARAAVEESRAQFEAEGSISAETLAQVQAFAPVLRVVSHEQAAALTADDPGLADVLDELLYKLDIIPAGLALGQAAYESGYGTSRFAAEGNALFGQWTFGGEGLKPEQQRQSLGDHRIAAFDWPFDSVRAYFINLMSHPAYAAFRDIRAARRAAGEPLRSLDLADGLLAYSERGQAYVDTLKGIIRVNNLALADDAVLRDEPRRFIVGAEDAEDAERIRSEIEALRTSGELHEIIERMDLD
jgi:Bax protein